MTEPQARGIARAIFGAREGEGRDDPASYAKLFAATFRVVMGRKVSVAMRKRAKAFKTEEQLAKEITKIQTQAVQLPTLIRQAFKALSLTLPRRGGPGRTPKLTD